MQPPLSTRIDEWSGRKFACCARPILCGGVGKKFSIEAQVRSVVSRRLDSAEFCRLTTANSERRRRPSRQLRLCDRATAPEADSAAHIDSALASASASSL